MLKYLSDHCHIRVLLPPYLRAVNQYRPEMKPTDKGTTNTIVYINITTLEKTTNVDHTNISRQGLIPRPLAYETRSQPHAPSIG